MDAEGGGNDDYGDEDEDNDAKVMWPSHRSGGNDRADDGQYSDDGADHMQEQEVMWPSAAGSNQKNSQAAGRQYQVPPRSKSARPQQNHHHYHSQEPMEDEQQGVVAWASSRNATNSPSPNRAAYASARGARPHTLSVDYDAYPPAGKASKAGSASQLIPTSGSYAEMQNTLSALMIQK